MNLLSSPRLPLYLFTVLLFVAGAALLSLVERQPGINDTIGYVYAGQRLAEGEGMSLYDPHNDWQRPFFTMYAFRIQQPGDERLYLVFPPGLPLLLATAVWLTGLAAAVHYVTPLLALLGVGGAFGLGKLVSDSNWGGLWAAMLLLLTPAFWTFSTAAWSEAPSMSLLTWGTVLYLAALKENVSVRRQILAAGLGGALVGFAFFIRYTNAIILPVFVLVELICGGWRFWQPKGRYAFFVAAGLAFLAIPLFNQVYYGGPTLTGYSPEHGWYPWSAFSLAYVWGPSPVGGYSGREIGRALWQNMGWLSLLLPLGLYRLSRPYRLIILGVTTLTILLYAIYAFAPVGINSRFLLPIFPFILAAVSAGLLYIGEKLPSGRWRWALGVIALLALTWQASDVFTDLQRRNTHSQNMANRMQALVADTDPNAVFLSYTLNDHIYFYGRRSVLNYRYIPPVDPVNQRYKVDFLEPCLVTTINELLAQGIDVYYIDDSSPSYWGTLPILQAHFELILDRPEMQRQRIAAPLPDSGANELVCPPRHP